MKIILTGATGMVGEGVLLTCLEHPLVTEILIVGRRHYELQHPKLKELIVPDFMQLEKFSDQLQGYDACFFCAGVSSIGMNEEKYTQITFTTTLRFAQTLALINPDIIFDYVTGRHTDSTEKGRIMWARVKGKTENALQQLPFRGQYNFRPGFMKPVKGQKNVKSFFKPLILIFPLLFPKKSLTLQQVGLAMIHSVTRGYNKPVLEVTDIAQLSGN
jgi:uncharacterized protein YbjT (DUF2867 family)